MKEPTRLQKLILSRFWWMMIVTMWIIFLNTLNLPALANGFIGLATLALTFIVPFAQAWVKRDLQEQQSVSSKKSR